MWHLLFVYLGTGVTAGMIWVRLKKLRVEMLTLSVPSARDKGSVRAGGEVWLHRRCEGGRAGWLAVRLTAEENLLTGLASCSSWARLWTSFKRCQWKNSAGFTSSPFSGYRFRICMVKTKVGRRERREGKKLQEERENAKWAIKHLKYRSTNTAVWDISARLYGLNTLVWPNWHCRGVAG